MPRMYCRGLSYSLCTALNERPNFPTAHHKNHVDAAHAPFFNLPLCLLSSRVTFAPAGAGAGGLPRSLMDAALALPPGAGPQQQQAAVASLRLALHSGERTRVS